MFPNASYHFPINGGWHFNPDWCATFRINQFVSPQAKLWAPALIDIQNLQFIAPMMSTFADREAQAHLLSTPAMASSLTKAAPASALKMAPTLATATLPASAPAPALAAAPAPAPAPASAPAPDQVPDLALASVTAAQRDFDRRLAEMEAKYRAEVEHLRSRKQAHFPQSPDKHVHRKVIDVDQQKSPAQKISFDAFKMVSHQYSPAFTETAPTDRHSGSNTFSARQVLFANAVASQQIRWLEALNWTLESPAD
jgi:hypothetical protein